VGCGGGEATATLTKKNPAVRRGCMPEAGLRSTPRRPVLGWLSAPPITVPLPLLLAPPLPALRHVMLGATPHRSPRHDAAATAAGAAASRGGVGCGGGGDSHIEEKKSMQSAEGARLKLACAAHHDSQGWGCCPLTPVTMPLPLLLAPPLPHCAT
jgi:hypothetical protein